MRDDIELYKASTQDEGDLTRRASQEKSHEGEIITSSSELDNSKPLIQDDVRPMMYTFYEKVKQGEDALIDAWSEEWQAIGFDTHVLTMEDAKKHHLYDKMESVVKPVFRTDYNAMCFYRWLAMANHGGWMSDYDTFPTNFPIEEAYNLPNNGTLTSFELHVPSLISGENTTFIVLIKNIKYLKCTILYFPPLSQECTKFHYTMYTCTRIINFKKSYQVPLRNGHEHVNCLLTHCRG